MKNKKGVSVAQQTMVQKILTKISKTVEQNKLMTKIIINEQTSLRKQIDWMIVGWSLSLILWLATVLWVVFE